MPKSEYFVAQKFNNVWENINGFYDFKQAKDCCQVNSVEYNTRTRVVKRYIFPNLGDTDYIKEDIVYYISDKNP